MSNIGISILNIIKENVKELFKKGVSFILKNLVEWIFKLWYEELNTFDVSFTPIFNNCLKEFKLIYCSIKICDDHSSDVPEGFTFFHTKYGPIIFYRYIGKTNNWEINVYNPKRNTKMREFIELQNPKEKIVSYTILSRDKYDQIVGTTPKNNTRIPLETGPIYIPDELNLIFNECKRLKDSNNIFVQKGMNIKRGFLLYGLPGTGKSTFVMNISRSLNIPLIKLDVKTLPSSMLYKVFIQEELTIIMIEDIDCLFNGRESIDKNMEVSFDTMLECFSNANNCIIFTTTNDINKLDPALLETDE
jgi:hypothetical protein